jgi:spermidine/putrescine transport system permease protein
MTAGEAAARIRRRARQPAGRPHPLLTAPSLVYLTVLIGVPLAVIVGYSLLSRARFGVGVALPITAEPYVQLLFQREIGGGLTFDPTYLGVIWTSVWLAALTTAVCLVLAVPVAVWIATRPPRRRPFLVFLVTIPFWTNTLVRTYAFLIVLNDTGPVNGTLTGTGLVDEPLPLLYNDAATTVGLVATFLPFMILPVYASAERFDFRLAEAAYDLGATRWTVFRRIVLPSIRPGILAGTALVFIPAIGAFLQPDLLGGGTTLMIGNVVQAQFTASRNWPFGAALSVLLLVLTLVAVLVISRVSRRTGVARTRLL